MKKLLIAFCVGFSCSLFAAPYVTNVVAKQRYPWGIVDISCDVKGIEESREIGFSIEAVLPDSGEVKKASAVRFRGAGNTNTDGLIAAADGNYRFVWNANADLGSANYTNTVVRIGIYKIPNKVQLWEDGPYWAEMNIGANEPWEAGYYFWWGDTVGYKRENDKWVASDGSNSNFSFDGSNTPTHGKGFSLLKSEGWITAEGVLAPEYDAAKKHCGGNWRMPTKAELDALNGNCDWIWITTNGVNGYVVRGYGDYASASIFLPCTGYGQYTLLRSPGSDGRYWSSNCGAGGLGFISSDHDTDSFYVYEGNPIRPVLEFINVISSSDSAPITIGSGVMYLNTTNQTHSIEWDATWVGENESAEVVITDNGVEIKRATGSGTFDYTVKDYEPHILTYTTYIGGVPQDEVYTATFNAIDCEGMGVPGLQRVTFTGSAYDTSHIALGAEPIVTLDGEGMYDSTIGANTTYAYSGYMYFKANETYTFRAYFDDYSSVMVDNKIVVAKNNAECKEGTGSVSFETAGWRKVEFRVSNGGGNGGLVGGAGYQGVWYQTNKDAIWRKMADDGSGTLLRTGPDYCGVVILKAAMRPSDPTIMDVVYKVVSHKETVKVRALAYQDGNRSFANAVPVLTFADGTEANIGDNVPANKELTLSWQVAADWSADLEKVRFEVMVMDDELLPLHFVTIPKTPNHAAIKYSDTVLTATPIMNALFWLYASQTEGLTLTNGRLKYNGTELANGTNISNPAATMGMLYGMMGYSVLSGEDLNYVNAAARISLSPSGIRQFAVKTITE